MLVDRYTVETKLGGELELVEIAVVELVPFLRIEVAVRQDHPGGAVPVGVAHVQVGIGHEMKHEDFHRAGSRTCCSPWTIVRGSACFTSVARDLGVRRRDARATVESHSRCNSSPAGLAAKAIFAGHLAGPTADPLASNSSWHARSRPRPFEDKTPG